MRVTALSNQTPPGWRHVCDLIQSRAPEGGNAKFYLAPVAAGRLQGSPPPPSRTAPAFRESLGEQPTSRWTDVSPHSCRSGGSSKCATHQTTEVPSFHGCPRRQQGERRALEEEGLLGVESRRALQLLRLRSDQPATPSPRSRPSCGSWNLEAPGEVCSCRRQFSWAEDTPTNRTAPRGHCPLASRLSPSLPPS